MTDKLRNNSLYDTFSDKEKQIYWNGRIIDIYRGDYGRFPIKISDFRNNIGVEEDNFESFIPGIIESFEKWLGEDFSIEDFFILDEQAQKKLGLWEDINIKKNTTNILDGDFSISGIEIPTSELIENIGDLYYDSLAMFLLEISTYIQDSKTRTRLVETSKHINDAWKSCEKFGKNHPKHSDKVKETSVSNDELAEKIGGLEALKLHHFIKLLGEKIRQDGEADKNRGREKLSKNLFLASEKLCETRI